MIHANQVVSTILLAILFIDPMWAQQPSFGLDHESQKDCNSIRKYLIQEASKISKGFTNRVPSKSIWEGKRSAHRDQLIEMLGLTDVPLTGMRETPPVQKVGILKKEKFRIEKIIYESSPGLYVPANLYIPNDIRGRTPAILYVCGHARNQKAYKKYQGNARKFAELGFVCLVIETIQWGEVEGEHWGTYARGWFHWLSRGYHPGGVEVWNGIRGIDLLASLPEVDADKIGVTGASGGGSQSWYLGALDDRIKAAVPVAGGETIEAEIFQKTVDHHCDCMMPHNIYHQDFSDMGALIAPRPLMIAAPSRDAMFAIESVSETHQSIADVYDFYNSLETLEFIHCQGGHGDRDTLRPQIFSFFLKHLMNQNVNPETVGDIDMSDAATIPDGDLAVYVDGAPANDRTKYIQDEFVKLAVPPALASGEELEQYRRQVLTFLKDRTFNHFPRIPVDFDAQWSHRAHDDGPFGRHVYSFMSEEGWRLKVDIQWRRPPHEVQPLLLVLRSPDEDRYESESFVSKSDTEISHAYLEVRGVGELGWAANQQWHIRRASAWIGRTIASMQVYDVIRSLAFLRSLPVIQKENISLAARDGMAAVAMYAALLDGQLASLIVQDPPPTQDQPSRRDGRGEAIEMMHCLQVTDLPQVAGILGDTKLFSIGRLPLSYDWALELHRDVLKDENLAILQSISEWKMSTE
ncbi:MAG: hypothetical protein HKN87_03315 [Saprospiraceae bacterium]|nr:hypothetical protein [Saprospiraceae bacterium]